MHSCIEIAVHHVEAQETWKQAGCPHVQLRCINPAVRFYIYAVQKEIALMGRQASTIRIDVLNFAAFEVHPLYLLDCIKVVYSWVAR